MIKQIHLSSNNQNFDGKVRRIGAQLSLAHYFDKLTLRERVSYIVPKVTSGIYDGKEFAGVCKMDSKCRSNL